MTSIEIAIGRELSPPSLPCCHPSNPFNLPPRARTLATVNNKDFCLPQEAFLSYLHLRVWKGFETAIKRKVAHKFKETETKPRLWEGWTAAVSLWGASSPLLAMTPSRNRLWVAMSMCIPLMLKLTYVVLSLIRTEMDVLWWMCSL